MTNSRGRALLTGNSLVSFSDGMSEQEKSDILDCLNYAQAQADSRYRRRDAWSDWMRSYQAVLYNNGFKLTGALSNESLTITKPEDLLYVTRDALQATGHPELSELAYSALQKLLGSQQAQAFFEDWFSASQSESFQMVPCRKEPAGGIDVLICGIRMHTEAQAGTWFQRPTSSMTITLNGGAFLYTSQGYEPFRESVTNNLERYTRLYFANLA
jgi:hypothetical protein